MNNDVVRIREFELNGQKFRVRVPLSIEAENIYEKTKEPDAALLLKCAFVVDVHCSTFAVA